MAHAQGESSTQNQAAPTSATRLITLAERQGWDVEQEWTGDTFTLDLSAETLEGSAHHILVWVAGRYSAKESPGEPTLKAVTEEIERLVAVEPEDDYDECGCEDPEEFGGLFQRVCLEHASGPSETRSGDLFHPGHAGWGVEMTRNYELAEWQSDGLIYRDTYKGDARLDYVIPRKIFRRHLQNTELPQPVEVGNCSVRVEGAFEDQCEEYGVRLYSDGGRAVCAAHAAADYGCSVESLRVLEFDEEEQVYAADLKADAAQLIAFRGAEKWAEEQDEAGRYVPQGRGWEEWAEKHHQGDDFLVSYRRWLVEREWDGKDWAAWAFEDAPLSPNSVPVSVGRAGLVAVEQAAPLALVPAYGSPEHVTDVRAVEGGYVPACACGWVQDAKPMQEESWARGRAASHRDNPYLDMGESNPNASVVLLPEGIPGVMSRYARVMELHGATAVVVTSAYNGGRRVAVANLTPVEVPHLYLSGDRPYLGAAWVGVDHMPDPFHVVTYGGRRVRVSDLTPAEDMPEVVTEELGKGWQRCTVLGETYESVRMPDSITNGRGKWTNLTGVTLNASGALVGRTFNGADDESIYWAAAHPATLESHEAGYVSIGEGRRITELLPLTEAERAYIAAGPQPTETKSAKKSTGTGGEITMGRGSKAPRKAAAVKVGDIVFSSKNTFPCIAKIMGHSYVLRKLARTFSAQHEHSDGARLVFEDEDPKNRCRTGGDAFPNLPAVKRAILADAVSRGEAVEERQEEPEPVDAAPSSLPRPLRLALEREAAEEQAGECEEDAYDPFAEPGASPLRAVESDAVKRFPELAQFMEPRPDGAPLLVLNLFSGPGGMVMGLCEVLRQKLGRDVEVINIDNDPDCVKTLRAAGFFAIQADVTTLDPSDPVFRQVRGLIVTPPCTDYTDSGKRLGRLPENVDILSEAWDSARRAAGAIPMGDMGLCPEFGRELEMKLPNGMSWGDVRADMDDYTGSTGHLMLELAIWGLGLQAAGAPLEWVAVEQSSKLPEQIRGEAAADFQLMGWATAEWMVRDAADFGSPTQRVRALMVARRDSVTGVTMEAPGLRTGAATATGLPEGTPVYTRGVGKRSGGGNIATISDERPYTAFTSRIRSVDVGEKGGRFTLAQIMRLITVPESWPVVGSRTSVCQQVGDVVAPVVAAALLAMALGIEWLPHLERFLREQYPEVYGEESTGKSPADGEKIQGQGPAGELAPVICGGLFMPKVPRTLAAIEKQVRTEMAYRAHEDAYRSRLNRQERRAAHAMLAKEYGGERTDLTGYGKTLHGKQEPTPPAVLEGESVQPMNPGWAQEWWLFADKWGYGFEVSHRGGRWYGMARLDEWQSDAGVSIPGKLVSLTKGGCDTAEELLNLCRAVGERRAVQDAGTRMVRRVVLQGAEPLALAWVQPAAAVAEAPRQLGLEAAPVRLALMPAPEPVVLPSTGRGFWNTGDRVIHQGRAGRVVGAGIGVTRVVLDGAEEWQVEKCEPRDLVAEAYVVCGGVMMPTMPEKPEPVAVDPRLKWMDYKRPAPVDPRLEWAQYERPAVEEHQEQPDVLAELRAELAAERADFERWSEELDDVVSYVDALVVAAAEEVVRRAERELMEMRTAELAVMRRQAASVREELELLAHAPMTTRARPGKAVWGLAASVVATAGAGWAEGWTRGISG